MKCDIGSLNIITNVLFIYDLNKHIDVTLIDQIWGYNPHKRWNRQANYLLLFCATAQSKIRPKNYPTNNRNITVLIEQPQYHPPIKVRFLNSSL